MFLTWLRKGKSLWNTVRRVSRPCEAPRRTSSRPRLETLEGRWLPSTLTVLNTNDSGAGSLRATIAASKSDDTINFDTSLNGQTITLTSGELVVDHSLDVEGPASSPVAILGIGSRAFDITNPSSTVTLANLDISGLGGVTQGGAIYDAGASVTLVGDQVSSQLGVVAAPNGNRQGGAIYQAGGALTVISCRVSGHVFGEDGGPGVAGSDGLGGGIYLASGTLTLTKCSVFGRAVGGAGGADGNALGGVIYEAAGNLAMTQCTLDGLAQGNNAMGGDIYNADGMLTLTDCTFQTSHAEGSTAAGGAIYDAVGTTTTITNCVFNESETVGATALGGSIYQAGGSLTVTGAQFPGSEVDSPNYGLAAGGAIYVAGGNVSMVNTTIQFAGVFAHGGVVVSLVGSALGGALYQAGGSLSLTNCTFANDEASGGLDTLAEGGALYIAGGTTTIQKCAFDSDSAVASVGQGSGGAIYIAGGSVCISKNTTFAGNIASTSDPDVFGSFTLC
jgi:hypothetical protein